MRCHSVGCGNGQVPHAIGYAKFYSRSHDAVIRVFDDAGNVIGTHEHTGDFKEWRAGRNKKPPCGEA
jgi:hypothetical protein